MTIKTQSRIMLVGMIGAFIFLTYLACEKKEKSVPAVARYIETEYKPIEKLSEL